MPEASAAPEPRLAAGALVLAAASAPATLLLQALQVRVTLLRVRVANVSSRRVHASRRRSWRRSWSRGSCSAPA